MIVAVVANSTFEPSVRPVICASRSRADVSSADFICSFQWLSFSWDVAVPYPAARRVLHYRPAYSVRNVRRGYCLTLLDLLTL